MRPVIRPHGGYRKLRSFQVSEIIYDGTVSFCNRFIDRRSRTHDQMVQAARSGRQNIAEGSRASGTSRKSELKLVNVARASLEELLLDYEDYLRQRNLPAWEKDDEQAILVRKAGRPQSDPSDRSDPSDQPARSRQDQTDPTDQTDRTAGAGGAGYENWLGSDDPAVVANALICLIHQANYLLDRQIAALEAQFVREGGFGEQLFAARRSYRSSQPMLPDPSDRSDRSDPTAGAGDADPVCPTCGRKMLLRTAKRGIRAGSRFWGCSGYPECATTVPAADPSKRHRR